MPTVLIIDDEPNIRRMVGALLGAEGYEVRDASDGVTGISRAADHDPDVVLLDLMMPGNLDGMQTLERLDTPKFIPVTISDKADVYPALRHFFGPNAGKLAPAALAV